MYIHFYEMLEGSLLALSLLPLTNYPLLQKFAPGSWLDMGVVLGEISSPRGQAVSRQTPHR